MNRRHRGNRKGNALVELVVGFPILFLLTFGSIEASTLNHLQQCATETSYLGALRGIPAGSTEADILFMMNAMLYARGIDNPTVTVIGVDGTPFDNLAPGDKFRVTTTIPATDNLPMVAMICSINDMTSDRIAEKN
ncbi:MAG: TadE/TadG family type IV pilus assembly protein [Pirellulaceae bacterium]